MYVLSQIIKCHECKYSWNICKQLSPQTTANCSVDCDLFLRVFLSRRTTATVGYLSLRWDYASLSRFPGRIGNKMDMERFSCLKFLHKFNLFALTGGRITQKKNLTTVHLCIYQYCRCLSVKQPLLFSQDDMPRIRKRIYKELCDRRLNDWTTDYRPPSLTDLLAWLHEMVYPSVSDGLFHWRPVT